MNHNKYIDLLLEQTSSLMHGPTLQAKVKDIKPNISERLDVYHYLFIDIMQKFIGKVINVKQRTDDSDWYQTVDAGNKFVYHKSWLDFNTQQQTKLEF